MTKRDNLRYVVIAIAYDDKHPVPQVGELNDSIAAAVGRGLLTPSGQGVVGEYDLAVHRDKEMARQQLLATE